MEQIKLMLWNMEWLNDLFDESGQFYDDAHKCGHGSATVKQRKDDLKGVIDKIAPDILVVVEGPNKAIELKLFFDFIQPGSWKTELQPTSGSSQCIGVAINTLGGKFGANPLVRFDTTGFPEFQKFEFENKDSGITELHKFERLPLYIEITSQQGNKFRIMGLHLKSKGIFSAYEWSKWWEVADANRKKLLAQAMQVREKFLDKYLTDAATKDIPLIVCGDINDGPGMDASEKKLLGSGIEKLMGNIWFPELCLGSAIFDTLKPKQQKELDFSEVYSTSFKDPIFNGVYQKEWIDHILYTKNKQSWVSDAKINEKLADGTIIWKDYKNSSDHFPVTVTINF